MIVALVLAAAIPSFDCAKARSAVERFICNDSALSISDKAVDLAYRAARVRNVKGVTTRQRNWLKDRDYCRNPTCVALSYEGRLDDLLPISGLGRSYEADGGSLTVVSLGDEWFAFSVLRTYSRPSLQFRSQSEMTDASASGVFRLAQNKGEQIPQPGYAGWRLTKIRGGWKVECLPDITSCGGINATIDGAYR